MTALGGPQPTESEQERAAAGALDAFRATGFGYFLEQATRPQTIGYALLDSPVALAAWMLDHDTDSYQKISRAFVDGQPAGNLTRDHIVDNITVYWLTGTGASAARSYWESGRAQAAAAGQAPPEVSIPVGFTTFPDEIFRAPRSWVENSYPSLTYFNEVDKGGHFAAWEEPQLFSEEMRAAFKPLREGSRRLAMDRIRHAVDMLTEGHLASFDGATGWLNSEPLTPEGLRGKVVLVDFWTYTCINWLRTLGYVRAWAEKYEDQGLVVVGVHTPEFPFEKDVDNVRGAVKDLDVDYPDRPRLRLCGVDAPSTTTTGRPCTSPTRKVGSGTTSSARVDTRSKRGSSSSCWAVDGRPRVRAPDGLEAQADWSNLESPETYLGYQQAENFASPGGAELDEPRSLCRAGLAEAQPVGSLG